MENMSKKELIINALLISARDDMKKGIAKNEILHSLSRIVDRDIFTDLKNKL